MGNSTPGRQICSARRPVTPTSDDEIWLGVTPEAACFRPLSQRHTLSHAFPVCVGAQEGFPVALVDPLFLGVTPCDKGLTSSHSRPVHMHRYASAWTSTEAGETLSPVQATKSAPSPAAPSRASLRAFISPVCQFVPDCLDEPWTIPRNLQPLAAAPRSISRICAAAGLSVVAHPTRAKTTSLVILARLAIPTGRVTDGPGSLTNWPIADKYLTLTRADK